MFIFEAIGRMIGEMIKLVILLAVILATLSFYGNDKKDSSFSLAIEPVYTEKKPHTSGLIIPKHDPRFYQEIE